MSHLYEGKILHPFQQLLDRDKLTTVSNTYEGVMGISISTLQYYVPDDIEWYMGVIGSGDGNIFDLMSGFGRIAKVASELGWKVYSIDNSPDVLSFNRYKDSDINYILQDVLSLDLGNEKGDFIVCGGRSISLLPKKSRINLFHTVKKHLKPNGLFSFDIYDEFNRKKEYTDIIPLNLNTGRLLWCKIETFPIDSSCTTNFLLEPNAENNLRFRYISSQTHYGISKETVLSELQKTGLNLQILETLSPSGKISLPYHRVVVGA